MNDKSKDSIKSEDIRAIYDQVGRLQKRVFGSAWPRDIDRAIEVYVKFIHMEADEALRETNYKEHKAKKPIDMSALGDEICDIFIYSLAMAGCTFESFDAFIRTVQRKADYNETRQDWEINRNE